MTTDNDLSQVPSSTTTRSLSVDSITNQTSPQRIIVTEQIAPSPPRSNNVDSATVDFDRPPANIQGYVRSPWANSSTPTTATTESASRPGPLPLNRMLPVQFNGNTKAPASTSVSVLSTTETTNSKTPITTSSSNIQKIPPPGMHSFSPIESFSFSLVQLKFTE
jgi:hypothetical protein